MAKNLIAILESTLLSTFHRLLVIYKRFKGEGDMKRESRLYKYGCLVYVFVKMKQQKVKFSDVYKKKKTKTQKARIESSDIIKSFV
jgi:hypothetical protein